MHLKVPAWLSGFTALFEKVANGFVTFKSYVVISLKFELLKDGVFDSEVVWVVGGVSEIRLRLFLQSVLLSFLMHLLDAVFCCEDQSIGKVSCCCCCVFLKRAWMYFLFCGNIHSETPPARLSTC